MFKLNGPITINHVFACSMVTGKSLTDAAKEVGAAQDVLVDAVALRMNVAVDKNIRDYHESITECFKRLEAMN